MRTFFKKVLYIVLMMFIISVISFVAIHAAPNSFFASGELNPNITKESIEHLKEVYGLDKPLAIQYISWVWAIIHLDFGVSFASGEPVKTEILSHIGITLLMNFISIIFVFLLSIYFGIKAAFKQNTLFDKSIKQFALVSYAMPSFYLALLLVSLFSVYLKWLPISGLHSIDPKTGIWWYFDFAGHLLLPIFVMIFGGVGTLSMYVRSLSLEILKSDYIYFAKSRGIDDKIIFKRFIIPNLYPPIVTILGLSIPGMIGGSVILESIFSINGMGLLFFQSAMSRDYPVIMGILIISTFLTLFGNIVADLILLKLNPHFAKAKQ